MNGLLLRGADIILANGLARGEYVDLVAGDPPLPVDKCPMCPRSAIATAADRDPLFVVEWPMHCDALAKQDSEAAQPATAEDAEAALIVSEAERAAYAEICSAERLLRRYLVEQLRVAAPADESDGGVIEMWADEDGRTQQQVVGAMRAAAEYTPAGAR